MKRLSNAEDEAASASPATSPAEKRSRPGRGVLWRSFHGARQGEREAMEDHVVALEDLLSHASPPFEAGLEGAAFFGVYDGHCGARAAAWAAKELHGHLLRRLPRGPDLPTIEAQIKRWFVEAYKATDEDFLRQAANAKPAWKDGTTATTALLLGNSLTVANVGDSKAVLCRIKEDGSEAALLLTKEHSPLAYEERMRIQKAGGCVTDGRVLGQLEVSRSIGDGAFKKHGVSCVPELKRARLGPKDRYLLVACDGLWKVFSAKDALAFVAQEIQRLEKSDAPLDETAEDRERRLWTAAADGLAAAAVRKGSEDNVSVLIVRLYFQ